MKIKELVVEGIWDYAKGLVSTGSLAGAQAASQQAAGERDIKNFTNQVFQKWNQYTGQTRDTDVVGWANKFFKRDVTSIGRPATNSAVDVKTYLTKVSQAYKAGALPANKSLAPTTTTSTTSTSPEAEKPAMPLSRINKALAGRAVKVLSRMPLRIQFSGQNYTVDTAKGTVVNMKDTHTGQPATTSAQTKEYLLDIGSEIDTFDPLPAKPTSTAKEPAQPTASTTPSIPAGTDTVTTPAEGVKVTKTNDGKWIRHDNGKEVTDPGTIKQLERLAVVSRQTQAMTHGNK